jgi:Lon protease-like protein
MEIGLFPLGIVLLPTERVPLHIFEPRYRELIGECIELESEFGLVFADENGVRELGTRARVDEVLEQFDDGRMNIVVEGGERFLVEKLTRGRSFMTAEVAPVDDDGDAPEPGAVVRAAASFRALAAAAEAEAGELDDEAALVPTRRAGRARAGVEAGIARAAVGATAAGGGRGAPGRRPRRPDRDPRARRAREEERVTAPLDPPRGTGG